MTKYLMIATLLLLGSLFLLQKETVYQEKTFLEEKHEPFDHFYFQRSYPDLQMDYVAFNAAFKKIREHQRVQKTSMSGQWLLEGPTNIGGRINAIEVHPLNPNHIFVGTASGGVFKTTNGGSTWTSIGNEFAHLAISAIAIAPNNPNVMYVGTGDLNITAIPHIGNGVYKSTDGGMTWVHMGLENECIISRIVVDPSNANVVYAAAMGRPMIRDNNRGLYKSTDGGNNWSQVLYLSDQTGIIDLVMDPFNSDVIYCSGWDRIETNQEKVISGTGARIWKTVDGGLNWNHVSNIIPPSLSLSRIGLAMSHQTPNLIFASIVDESQQLNSIYKSMDGGGSWAPVGQNGLDPNAMGGFGWFFGQIRVSPYDDNALSILGVELYSTFDGGNNWFKTVPDWENYEVHADCHDMVYIDPTTILLATDGGLYKSTNNMVAWEDIDEIPNTQFYRIAINPHQPGVYAGGAQDNGTTSGNHLSVNTWPREYGGDGFQPIYDPTDENIRYYEAQNGWLICIINGGGYVLLDTSIPATDRKNWNTPFMMSQFNSKVLYTGTHKVYKMTGAPYGSFTPLSDDLTDGVIYGDKYHTISSIAESPLDSLLLYAGTSDGNVWNSIDGGANWNNVTGALPDRYVTSVHGSPTMNNAVYVTHSGYKYNDFIPHVHKSTNNGVNWVDISGDLPQIAINDLCVYPNSMDSVLFVATDAGVYATLNGGMHWDRVGDMPLIPVFDIEIDTIYNKLIAGTFARSIQSFPIDSIVKDIPTSTNLMMVEESSIRVYPIPSNNYLYIDGVSRSDKTITSIFDLQGKKVAQISLPNKKVNKIDVSFLKQGVYLLQLNDGVSEPQTVKIIKK